MRFLSVFLAWILAAVEAKNLRVSLYQQDAGRQPLKRRDEQAPLRDEVSTRQGSVVTDWNNWMYFTVVEVGSPAQLFRLTLDICFRDMVLLSSNCTSWICTHGNRNLYDSSASSTYEANLAPVHGNYVRVYFNGSASTDIVRIGGLSVNHTFIEMVDATTHVPVFWLDEFEGAIGLARSARRTEESNLAAPTFLQNMVEQKVAERNMFSLKLPQSPDEPGSITFGGIDESLLDGELFTIPLTKRELDDPALKDLPTGGWHTSLHSISVGANGDQSELTVTLPNFTAVYSSFFPAILLPPGPANSLIAHFNTSQFGGTDKYSIPCDQITALPNITITFDAEKQQELVLEPTQYVIKSTDVFTGELECHVPFDSKPLGHGEDWPPIVIMGNPFLLGLYSVFDYESETLSIGKLK